MKGLISAQTISIALVALVGAIPLTGTPITVEDCIRMTRLQRPYRDAARAAVFSPDGTRFASVVSRGNLATNVNDYRLLLFDAVELAEPPQTTLAVSYSHDSIDPFANPISQMTFVNASRSLTFLGRIKDVRQVYSVDLSTRALKRITNFKGDVLAFGVAPDGSGLLAAVNAPPPKEIARRFLRDGFAFDEPEVWRERGFPRMVALGQWLRPQTRFVIVRRGSAPLTIHEAPRDRDVFPAVWMSPSGKLAAFYPYGVPGKSEPTLGLADIESGTVSLLSDVTPSFRRGRILWSHDESELLLSEPPHLYRIPLATKEAHSVWVGEDWDLLGWTGRTGRLLFARSGYPVDPDSTAALAVFDVPGGDEARLTPLDVVGDALYGLNPRYTAATNGRLVVGVKDSLTSPPELAAYDLQTKQTRILTDLNPDLRGRRVGEVSTITWESPHSDRPSFGYLIKPAGYEPGRRYPLIVQIKDEQYHPGDRSFILDGQGQLSGAAIQVWANAGFMVLFTPQPISTREVKFTPEEPRRVMLHIESGIDHLDRLGLIDRQRVALAGWSRAGYFTMFALMHSRVRFTAAAVIDDFQYNLNGFIFYPTYRKVWVRQWGGVLPWGPTSSEWVRRSPDFSLNKLRTPLLVETHGANGLLPHAEVYSALKILGVPIELLHFPNAPHSLRSPRHRLRSLRVHTDWFRFWLQDHEDNESPKSAQYRRWREMRSAWSQRDDARQP